MLEVDLEDLRNDRRSLHQVVLRSPNEYIPMMEAGARDVVAAAGHADIDAARIPPVQILFTGNLRETPVRQIDVSRGSRQPSVFP